MPVQQILDGVTPQCSAVYVVSPDDVVTLEQGVFTTTCSVAPEPGIDTIDALFETLAAQPNDQQQVMAKLERAVETKSVFEPEHRGFCVDGSLGLDVLARFRYATRTAGSVVWCGERRDAAQAWGEMTLAAVGS